MYIISYKLRILTPPKDDLLAAVFASKLTLQNGDVLAIASKVVSISEGRCIPVGTISKDNLVEREASLIVKEKPKWGSRFTITKGVLIRAAGIDESNGNGHYILWSKNPQESAAQLRRVLMRHYKVKKLGVLVTDSISTPLRRGALGFALAWAGFEPLFDYRRSKDLFGRTIQVEQANLADALAAAAVVVMGEGNEQTPLVVVRGAPEKIWKRRQKGHGWDSFTVPVNGDLFSPFLNKVKWRRGRGR
ncbi:MAG: coenzyme F420-0:L-glutamate ligase [bacterium]|nr:coenzyme F420-0:L-glutamate ligase [bacterium]